MSEWRVVDYFWLAVMVFGCLGIVALVGEVIRLIVGLAELIVGDR